MSAPLQNHNPYMRVGLYLLAALAVALVVGCGSEPAPAPQPAPTPTAGRDAVIRAIEDVPSPTAVSAAAPTATASVPAPPSGAGPSARSMAPKFSLAFGRWRPGGARRTPRRPRSRRAWCSIEGTSEGYVGASSASWQRRILSSRSAAWRWWQ